MGGVVSYRLGGLVLLPGLLDDELLLGDDLPLLLLHVIGAKVLHHWHTTTRQWE